MLDENICIQKIASGNQEALQALYKLYAKQVYNTILSYTKNQEDAEEVLQDVFISVFQKADQFKHDSTVKTWIYRIAVNKSLDFLRKKNSAKRFGIFTSLYQKNSNEIKYESPEFNHPGIQLENKEEAELLFTAIETLAENQQTAFILTQIDGISQAEVAEIMETSRKAVESLVQRAKKNLRLFLEKKYPERGKSKKHTSNE